MEQKFITPRELNQLLCIQHREKTVSSFINVLKGLLNLHIFYFAEYPEFRHTVIEKLQEYDDYEDDIVQQLINQLKDYLYYSFLEEDFISNEDETIDDGDYEYICKNEDE